MVRKPDPIETALDRLGELRQSGSAEVPVEELRRFLRHRSNLVVAKAGKLTGELKDASLIPDLVAAHEKFMADAPRLDKRCAAVTAIATALYELDFAEPDPYLQGLHHVQMEASFGPPVDAAANLRGICAQGLLRTRYPGALHEVLPLLVDREPPARIGAVRGLSSNGGEAGILLLKLKCLEGDAEPEVMAECFAGILRSDPQQAGFVARFLESQDEAIVESCILALGESRQPRALHVLAEKWHRTVRKEVRKVLLQAIAALRLEEGITFLVSVVRESSTQTAIDALEALSAYKTNERVRDRVSEAVSENRELAAAFREKFGTAND